MAPRRARPRRGEAWAVGELNTRREAEARIEAEQRSARSNSGSVWLKWWWPPWCWYSWAVSARSRGGTTNRRTSENSRTTRARPPGCAARGGRARRSRALLADEAREPRRNRRDRGSAPAWRLATDLRQQFGFEPAAAALAQAAHLAKSGAPELSGEVKDAQRTLALVVALDGIRYRKWEWVADDGGSYNTKGAPPAYRKALAEYGLDLTTLAPAESAPRIAASAVKAELVMAVDDWALHEPDEELRVRLLEVARAADPGPWTDRLRDPKVWGDRKAYGWNSRPTRTRRPTTPAVLSMLAELLMRSKVNPHPFLSAARAKYPTDFELAFVHGRWHAGDGSGHQIGPYEAARALRPDNPTVLRNLGVGLWRRGDFAGQIAVCKEALRLDPHNAGTYNNMSIALRDKGELIEAEVAGWEAVRLDPKFVMAYENLGNTLVKNGDLVGAIVAFQETVRLDPKFARAHNNLGAARKDNGDLDGAIVAYKAAIAADDKYATPHNNLGVALRIKGDLIGAIGEFREAVRLNPKLAVAQFSLALALQDAGDLNGAIAAYKAAIAADDKYAEAHTNLGSIYSQQQKYPEAIECARARSQGRAQLRPALRSIGGGTSEDAHDTFGARKALTEAAKIDPKKWAPVLAKVPPPDAAPPPREAEQP